MPIIIALLTLITSAFGEVLKENENPNGGGHVVVCVGVNLHLRHPGLSLTTQTFAARPRDFCRAMAKHKGVAEVHLLTNEEATGGNWRATLRMLADKPNEYSRITLLVKTLGYGGDLSPGEQRLVAADWTPGDSTSALDLGELDGLMDQIANSKVLVLDASFPATDPIIEPLSWVGPSAPQWPSSDTAVLSPAGPRESTDCGDRMIGQITDLVVAAGPIGEVSMTALRAKALDAASDVRKSGCNTYSPAPYGNTALWRDGNFLNAVITSEPIAAVVTLPPVETPIDTLPTELQPTDTALPVQPTDNTSTLPRKLCPKSKLRKGGATGYLVTGVVATAVSVTSGILLNGVMQQVKDQDTINANFTTQAEADKVANMRPVWGFTTLGAAIVAGGTLGGAGYYEWCRATGGD